MRALLPAVTDRIVRDGVGIQYDVFGDGATSVLLLPAWSIVHSRMWKAQVPYLARHYRVVTFDGRGNGRSDRPRGPEAYRTAEFVADALAVLDATSTERAVTIGLSLGGHIAAMLTARHPERVTSAMLIAPSVPFGPKANTRMLPHFLATLAGSDGWDRFNRDYWRRDLRGFAQFFFEQCFPEAHSTKPIEDAVSWAMETSAETLIDTMLARGLVEDEDEGMYRAIRRPVVVVQGDQDRIVAPSQGALVAETIGAPLVVLEGSGHVPVARDPVACNRLIRDFVERTTGAVPAAKTVRHGMRRPRRALYLSSPIGLGHARRDLAIARALRERRPDVAIDWLTQHPVTPLLQRAGERVHSASRLLVNESAHVESESGEHDLHVFEALRRMDEIMVANFMVFQEVVEDGDYDLVIADESWDVDHFWHEHPELKRAALAWFTDFVGYAPMPEGGDREAFLTADYNAEMLEHVERHPRVRDRSIFVGNAADIVPGTFGPGLPVIREWTERHFAFSGYITGRDVRDADGRAELRRAFGFGDDEIVCIATVGGSAVGAHLLRRIVESAPAIRRRVPNLRMLAVAGPRIDVASLPRVPGVEIHGYVADLDRQLAACDIALVQGGLTTCMELTEARVPFVYFPIRHHFEQNVHVRHRLERYRAGRCMTFDEASPDAIAEAVVVELARGADFAPVERDGAARAAGLLADLL
jgi:pimeloyl-ACP methyl ester carboxylesterase/predicted glycosyltransferase